MATITSRTTQVDEPVCDPIASPWLERLTRIWHRRLPVVLSVSPFSRPPEPVHDAPIPQVGPREVQGCRRRLGRALLRREYVF